MEEKTSLEESKINLLYQKRGEAFSLRKQIEERYHEKEKMITVLNKEVAFSKETLKINQEERDKLYELKRLLRDEENLYLDEIIRIKQELGEE